MLKEDKLKIIIDARDQASKIYSDHLYRQDMQKKINVINHLSHYWFEKTSPKIVPCGDILELGASSEINIKYCQNNYNEYILSEKDTTILNKLHLNGSLNQFKKFKIKKIDATNINKTLDGRKFDRIIACNLLEHLPSPELVLLDWYDALNLGGTLSLLQPCDPGIFWRLGRNLGHRQKCIKKGYRYDLITALEHINPSSNLIAIISEIFGSESKFSYFPFLVKSWNFNLFFSVHITKKYN